MHGSDSHGQGFALRCSLGKYGLPATNDEGNNVPAKANQLANFPLNFLRTGVYEYVDGKVHYRTSNGGWSAATSNSDINFDSLYVNLKNILPQANNERGRGFALHYVCLPTTNEQNAATKANQLANFPLNFLRTGDYYYGDGKVRYRTERGRWWSTIGYSATNANLADITITAIHPQQDYYRGHGFALRCTLEALAFSKSTRSKFLLPFRAKLCYNLSIGRLAQLARARL